MGYTKNKYLYYRMARKDKEGGSFLSSLASAASRFAKVGTTAARVGTTTSRALVPVARATTTAARVGSTAARAATTVSAIGQAAQKASLASRAMSAANVAALGLGVGLPIYQLIDMDKQKKEADAQARAAATQAAMYDADYQKQQLATKAAETRYATDYENDRAKQATADALAEQRYNEAMATAADQKRIQDANDAKSYADLLEQQQTALALQAHLEEERTKRIEAAIQSAISAALRAKTPSVPANVATPSNPRPSVSTKIRGYGKHKRTMKDLEDDLAKLGYSL